MRLCARAGHNAGTTRTPLACRPPTPTHRSHRAPPRHSNGANAAARTAAATGASASADAPPVMTETARIEALAKAVAEIEMNSDAD